MDKGDNTILSSQLTALGLRASRSTKSIMEPFRFLQLPGECRNIIYAHLFSDLQGKIQREKAYDASSQNHRAHIFRLSFGWQGKRRTYLPPICFANMQIYAETNHLILPSAHLSLKKPAIDQHWCCPDTLLRQIRSLSLSFSHLTSLCMFATNRPSIVRSDLQHAISFPSLPSLAHLMVGFSCHTCPCCEEIVRKDDLSATLIPLIFFRKRFSIKIEYETFKSRTLLCHGILSSNILKHVEMKKGSELVFNTQLMILEVLGLHNVSLLDYLAWDDQDSFQRHVAHGGIAEEDYQSIVPMIDEGMLEIVRAEWSDFWKGRKGI